MNTDIRKHIISNFKNDDTSTIRNAIEESITDQDEMSLPGLGVFFEIVWSQSNEEEKNTFLERIKNKCNSN